jgi:hypothetical protein
MAATDPQLLAALVLLREIADNTGGDPAVPENVLLHTDGSPLIHTDGSYLTYP